MIDFFLQKKKEILNFAHFNLKAQAIKLFKTLELHLHNDSVVYYWITLNKTQKQKNDHIWLLSESIKKSKQLILATQRLVQSAEIKFFQETCALFVHEKEKKCCLKYKPGLRLL